MNGGMMPLPDGAPMPSHWLVYFGSEDVDASAETDPLAAAAP